MSHSLVIAGIGETLLAETPQGTGVAGLAANAARQAVRLECEGVLVTRLGQDDAASEVLEQSRSEGIDVTHVQSDPDLATGRLLVRRLGGIEKRSFDTWAAFDNLQWDFDLDDLAQRVDLVVCGSLSLRSGQTRSTLERFLAACTRAIRFVVLTSDGNMEATIRGASQHVLPYAEGVMLDVGTCRMLAPGYSPDAALEPVLAEIARRHALGFVLFHDETSRPSRIAAYAEKHICEHSVSSKIEEPGAVVVKFVVAMMRGKSVEESLRVALATT